MYEIQSGIPFPSNHPLHARFSKYHFDSMKIGDSFSFSKEEKSRVSTAATWYSKRHAAEGIRFAVRTISSSECRIWRIA